MLKIDIEHALVWLADNNLHLKRQNGAWGMAAPGHLPSDMYPTVVEAIKATLTDRIKELETQNDQDGKRIAIRRDSIRDILTLIGGS